MIIRLGVGQAERRARESTARVGAVWLAALAATAILLSAGDARAIPAFSRKYGTSCQTCHVIFPKLTPFGEAFRRNGFRFPGADQDYVKVEQIPLGQEAYKKVFPHAVWPGFLPGGVPIAFGLNGFAQIIPDKNSGAGQANDNTIFTLQHLVDEAHIWAGGSFSERITFFGELTFGSDGTLDLELGSVHFNDWFGLNHALNLTVGRFRSNLTSWGAHSSYLADTMVPTVPVTGLYGAKSDSWNLLNPFNGLELNGMFVGRVYYAVGINGGTNIDIRPTENAYAHLGFKIGGYRLDGENATVANPMRPWEDTAITVDGWFYYSASHFQNSMDASQDDRGIAYGGNIRAQWRSLELNAGAWQERHNHALVDGTEAIATTQYDELSYVALPWLVPALRVEYVRLNTGADGPIFWDLKIIPGIAALVTPNLKLVLKGQVEMARGAPDGGWGPAGGFAMPSMPDKFNGEIETLTLAVAYAY